MRKFREILQLHFDAKLSERQIAKICQIGKGTVRRYLKRAAAAGLPWPLPAELDDASLEKQLFPPPPPAAGRPAAAGLGGVPQRTEEPQERHARAAVGRVPAEQPGWLQHSWCCELYRVWARKLDVVLRQEHRAGEKMAVDHAGQTVPVTDPKSGEVREAYVFVAVLGASSYTYAEATGPAICGTGSARTCAPLNTFRGRRSSWYQTTGGPA